MQTEQDLDTAGNDLGPLAWVLDELRKSLESASSALRRFVRDAAQARGEDMASIDTGQLRLARQHMHQAVGALEMVGLGAPAHILRAMESAAQKFIERPELCTEAAAAKVERAGFALTEYLEALLGGKPVSALSLFPQYRDVQEVCAADRVHPADLWGVEWRWVEPASPEPSQTLGYDPAVRARMDQAVLRIVKSADPAAGRELADISLGLGASQSARQPRIFWRVAAGYFEAVALKLLPADVYVKRAASRVLVQYAQLAKGDLGVSDRLAQDLVFFCAQAEPAAGQAAPALAAVRQAYGQQNTRPVDYATSPFGRFDPILMAQARKRIANAKETWSALSGGDAHKLKNVAEQFQLVTDSLLKLMPDSRPFANAISQAIEFVVRGGRAPSAELAMEVATSILYLEAAFQDLDPSDTELTDRTNRLADRLSKVTLGGQPEPLEHWIEDLYRRVSDRQTMGSVVGELRGTLSELEKVLDQFFRDPTDKAPLRDAPGFLMQMRGVLSVLGLDHATQAVQRMRDTLEEMLVTEIDEAQARAAGTFERLGNNLGALGFLIDMLNYQPTLAKKLFTYDAALGELRPLMGRAEEPGAEAPAEAPPPAPSISPIEHMATQKIDLSAMQQATQKLDLSAMQQATQKLDMAALQQATQPMYMATQKLEVTPAPEATQKLDLGMLPAFDLPTTPAAAPAPVAAAPAPTAAPAPAPAAGAPAPLSEDEQELRDIFLEEAREVVGNGLAALDVLAVEPRNLGEMTTLRRAFHTLKGSSRMVGLTEFGEAAWSLEQVLNTWLADQKPATDELRTLSADALRGFGRWIEDIAALTDAGWKAGMFRVPADALRTEGRLVAFTLPGAAPAEAVAEAPTAVELPVAEAPAPFLPEPAPEPEPAPLAAAVEAPASMFAPIEAPAPAAPAEPQAAEPVFELPDLGGPPPDLQPVMPIVAATEEPPTFELPGLAEAAPSLPAEAPPPPTTEGIETIEISATEMLPELAAFEAAAAAPAPDAPVEAVEFGTTQVFRGATPEVAELPPGHVPPEFEMELGATLILPEPSAMPPVPPIEVAGIDFDSLAAVSAAAEPPVAAPAPAAEPAAAEALADWLPEAIPEEPAPAPVQSLDDWLPEAVPEVPATEAAAPAEVTEALVDPTRDEQVKVIGSLRIGIPLYNVYLNEADEWSRRLATEISEWTLEMNQRVPDSTVGWAHALGGSSATVGFETLSDVARALESALQNTQSLAYGTPAHAEAFTRAAEEIRRLLHQFAAGFLKEADPRVIEALQALRDLEIPARSDLADAELDGFAPPLDDDVPVAPHVVLAAVEPPVAAPAEAPEPEVSEAADLPAASAFASLAAVPAVAAAKPVTVEGEDESFDVVDAIDPDLFPIFEEEAAELMPSLDASLRQWVAHPGQREPRDQVLRALHTLKGSARLAGALRLGEQAHQMESEVEYLGHENINPADIEALLHRFDSMQARFDTLRATGGFAPAEPAAAEPVPVVAAAPVADAFAAEAPAAASSAPAESAEAALDKLIDAAVASTAVPRPMQSMGAAPTAMRAALAMPATTAVTPARQAANQAVRVRSQLLDRLVNQAGEVMITRSRLEAELRQLRGSLSDLTGNLDRLRTQLRDIELQAESQMQSRLAQAKDTAAGFDPLEFDRFTRVQELTRMMAESVNDVATVQRNIQRVVESTEDDLIAQARQTRELQRDLLRTRMVEFEGISDRLYRVVRLASKETGKQVKLDILGGTIEMDRGVLDRMTPAFEHLLRNCVAHGVESPEARVAAGKEAAGSITIAVRQEGNDVSVEFTDDGAGLDLDRIREKAIQHGLITADQPLAESDAANLIFQPGFSTAQQVTELSGRGIGMDVVRSEVNALGGRIETSTARGRGTSFKLVLPLTTAVTQVVMIRSGKLAVGVPANLVELVRRASQKELDAAYESGTFDFAGEPLPFFWSGALLQSSARSQEMQGKTLPVVVFRSAAQRVAVHVDEVLGNQEVVVKNLGPQLSRLPGLAGMTVLASGAVVLIYNPVALAQVFGEQARQLTLQARPAAGTMAADAAQPAQPALPAAPVVPQVPLVLVVDDSITVRRVTQRLLQREGYRVSLAADGLQALERLAEERPAVVLSDIEMPRMDGFDLARNIRGDARLKDLPIVMITSRIAEKHREHARELGVDHYLGKPYSEDELLALVRKYCEMAMA